MAVIMVKITEKQYEESLEKCNIEQLEGFEELSYDLLIGCNVARVEIATEIEGDAVNIVILERFDGHLQSIYLDSLIEAEYYYRNNTFALRQFAISNMTFNESLTSYSYKDHYTRLKYIPTEASIKLYIRWYWKDHKWFTADQIQVKATNLTKEQLKSVQSKAKLVGAQSGFVDYNTYAVEAKDRKTVFIYTTQKEIMHDGTKSLLNAIFGK
jgi:hypothetical protein